MSDTLTSTLNFFFDGDDNGNTIELSEAELAESRKEYQAKADKLNAELEARFELEKYA